MILNRPAMVPLPTSHLSEKAAGYQAEQQGMCNTVTVTWYKISEGKRIS